MPSVRASVFNQRERAEWGPFLLIVPAMENGSPSVDVFAKRVGHALADDVRPRG